MGEDTEEHYEDFFLHILSQDTPSMRRLNEAFERAWPEIEPSIFYGNRTPPPSATMGGFDLFSSTNADADAAMG